MEEEVILLKIEVSQYGEFILKRVKYEVDVLQKEMVGLGEAFNFLLGKIKQFDNKIGDLTSLINRSKLQAVTEIDGTLKSEVQVIVDQMSAVSKADFGGLEILFDNLEAIRDNYQFLVEQVHRLKEIGVNTQNIEKNVPALERGLTQLAQAIERRQEELIGAGSGQEKVDYEAIYTEVYRLIKEQSRLSIQQLRKAQLSADPKEMADLKQNQAAMLDNYYYIESQLAILQDKKDVTALREELKPLESVIKQFDKALDSNQFMKMTQKIYNEIELVTAQIAEAQQAVSLDDIPVLEENLDILLDNCDVLADELETLESSGLNVDGILEHYEVLRITLEQFQRVIQDAVNRIGMTQQGAFNRP